MIYLRCTTVEIAIHYNYFDFHLKIVFIVSFRKMQKIQYNIFILNISQDLHSKILYDLINLSKVLIYNLLSFYLNYSVLLFTSIIFSIEFEPWEVVTCLITAQLASEETFHGTKDYLALGANLSYGEEIPVRGRILILDVIDVVPEPGQPLTRHKLKIIHDGEQKGPVTALTSCQGHLISAIGQKVIVKMLL